MGKRSVYFIRPLFSNYPIVSDHRFETVETNFKKSIKKLFDNFKLSRKNADNLLWYMFNPGIDYKVLKIDIPLAKKYIRGNFGVAVFELQGKFFVCLPAFNNAIFFSNEKKVNEKELDNMIVKAITGLFKIHKERYGDDFDPAAYFASSGEFITNIPVGIQIQPGKFSFEKKSSPWQFSSFYEDHQFDGATEIGKVAENLNSHYPGGLKRAFYRDDLIESLYSIVYKTENTPLVLIGPEGVGKKTIIHELLFRNLKEKEFQAKTEADQSVKEASYSKIWHIDPTRIISGMSIIGWWQKRVEAILEFILSKKEGVQDKLLINNVIAMSRAGKSASNNLTFC